MCHRHFYAPVLIPIAHRRIPENPSGFAPSGHIVNSILLNGIGQTRATRGLPFIRLYGMADGKPEDSRKYCALFLRSLVNAIQDYEGNNVPDPSTRSLQRPNAKSIMLKGVGSIIRR